MCVPLSLPSESSSTHSCVANRILKCFLLTFVVHASMLSLSSHTRSHGSDPQIQLRLVSCYYPCEGAAVVHYIQRPRYGVDFRVSLRFGHRRTNASGGQTVREWAKQTNLICTESTGSSCMKSFLWNSGLKSIPIRRAAYSNPVSRFFRDPFRPPVTEKSLSRIG
jgi:hypothetical protein